MEQKGNMLVKNAMNYGLILGFFTALHYFVGQYFSLGLSFFYGLLSYVLNIVIAFWGTKHLRDIYEEGYMSYGRALGSTFLIYTFSGFILAMANYFVMKYVSPELLETFFTGMEQTYLQVGTSEDQVEVMVGLLRKITTPGSYSTAVFLGNLFSGFIYALILSFFLKKEKNIFED